MASPIHPKEQQIINYIKKITIERESKYLGYRLKFGKYKNKTLHDMFQTKQGTQHLLFLKNTTKSVHFKNMLKIAARHQNQIELFMTMSNLSYTHVR